MINNRYTILEKIGEGRSKVFACSDRFFPDEKIAIKILKYTASNSEIEYFNSEFEILKRFSHPGIISVHDRGIISQLTDEYNKKYKISKNDIFITLERIEGTNLEVFDGTFSELELRSIIVQISLALYYIHQANYIYFDLKPDNILLQKLETGYKIKLIDFGLTKFYPDLKSDFVKGTPEYIAPEILNNDDITFNSDLYSLGILLYKIIYNKFPFKVENSLEIFRAHIEKEFEFPSSRFSNEIVTLVKKLLSKNKLHRYNSSLEVINDLEYKLEFEERINLRNPLKYIEREEISDALSDYYVINSLWGNVAVLRGEKGSGKSLTIEKASRKFKDSVLIRTNSFTTSTDFWQQFFHRLLYSRTVYKFIDDSLIQYISRYVSDNSDNLMTELKAIISKIALTADFMLIIDDFDSLDQQTIEIFYELFPILLANQIKIVIALQESAEIGLPSNIEVVEFQLKPFSDEEIKRAINVSYNNFIDKSELQNLILSFSGRTPAQIEYFISELITLQIINYKEGRTLITYDENKITQLLSSHDEVFSLLKKKLSDIELKILNVVSLFENNISMKFISISVNISIESILEAIQSLRDKNILVPVTQNRNLDFASVGFKKFFYKEIVNVCQKHLEIGNLILEYFPETDYLITVRQFELGNNLKKANEIITKALGEKTFDNFPQTRIKLLHRKLSYPLNEVDRTITLLDMCESLSKLGKYNKALAVIKELDKKELSKYYKSERDKLLGFLYIRTGKIKEGIKLLIKVVNNLPNAKEHIYIELAGAYIDINNYEKADSLCREVLKSKDVKTEIKGRAKNLLGISHLHNKQDLTSTLNYFHEANLAYKQENIFNRIAGSEVNLGTIYNMLGKFSEAEKHWNKALQLNQSIGNVEQEANVLLNSGVFSYEHANYEKAIELYLKAGNIFKGLGNKINYGLVCSNLGECYLEMCEYDKSFLSLKEAEKIFIDLENRDEEIEVAFLLTKYFIFVSNYSMADEYLGKIKDIKNKQTEREQLLSNYVDTLYRNFLQKEVKSEINNLIENLYTNNQKILAADIAFIGTDNAIRTGQFDKAVEFITSSSLLDVTLFNEKYKAHRYYLQSKIPLSYQKDSTLSSENELLLKSYVILENGSISELIIDVLHSLASFYLKRGNTEQAYEYANVGKETINYIESQNKTLLSPKFEKRRSMFNNIIKCV